MKHNITIILYRPELVRCIKEMAYVVSKAGLLKGDEAAVSDHKIADILDKEDGGTDGNDYLGTRALNMAVVRLRAAVRKHAWEPAISTASHNAFSAPLEYNIHLTMETDAPKTMAQTLQELMNRYVALSTLGEWCKLLQSETASIYLNEADGVMAEIKSMINPPTRTERPLFPAW